MKYYRSFKFYYHHLFSVFDAWEKDYQMWDAMGIQLWEGTCNHSPVPLTARPELHTEQYNSSLFLCLALSYQVSCNERENSTVSFCHVVLCSSGLGACISSLTLLCSCDQLHLADRKKRRLWPCAAAGKQHFLRPSIRGTLLKNVLHISILLE